MVCASTCCRGVYIEVLSARLQESLKISVEKGSIQPWLGGDQPHNCQSDHSLNLPHAMPTLPHWPATPAPYPPPHSDRTGEPGYIHLYRIPSFNFILHVHLTCPLSSFSETNMQTVMVSRGTGILANLSLPFIWQFSPIYSLLSTPLWEIFSPYLAVALRLHSEAPLSMSENPRHCLAE